jgi:hypothetical protein
MIPDPEDTTEEVPWYEGASGVRYAVRLFQHENKWCLCDC